MTGENVSIESLFESDEPKRCKNVLVVDDSSMMRHVVARIVEQLGHQAIEATDGEDGLSKAFSALPDLIVLDVDMPKKNGVEFLEDLRTKARFISTPVIMLTAAKDREIMRQVARQKVKDFLVKPAHPKKLRARIRKYLG